MGSCTGNGIMSGKPLAIKNCNEINLHTKYYKVSWRICLKRHSATFFAETLSQTLL